MKKILFTAFVVSGLYASPVVCVSGGGIIATDQYIAPDDGIVQCVQLIGPSVNVGKANFSSFVNTVSEVSSFFNWDGWHLDASLLQAHGNTIGSVINILPSGDGIIDFLVYGYNNDGRVVTGKGVIVINYPSIDSIGGRWGAMLYLDDIQKQSSSVVKNPEPATMLLVGLALVSLTFFRQSKLK